MTNTKTVSFIVTMAIPSGVDVMDLMQYVHDEVTAGCGARDPADPIFHLDRESVTVRLSSRLQKIGPKL